MQTAIAVRRNAIVCVALWLMAMAMRTCAVLLRPPRRRASILSWARDACQVDVRTLLNTAEGSAFRATLRDC